jgi:ketosteroid isomerase-like protein
MKTSLACLLVALCLCSTQLRAADATETFKTELREVERAFEAMASEKGIEAAFVHYAADDAVFFDVDPQKLRGPAALSARRAQWASIVALKWTPVGVEVAGTGDLGYTWGTGEMHIAKEDGTVQIVRCLYVTVWRRGADGKWRFVLDTGSEYPKS